MKPKLFIISLIISISGYAQNQYKPFYFRGGLSLFLADTKTGNDALTGLPCITLAPGLNFIKGKDFCLSLTSPVSLGASKNGSYYFGFDLPAMLEAHFGSATGNQDKKSLGFMIGSGVAYYYAANDYESYNVSHSSFIGYRFHSGISFGKDLGGDRLMFLVSYGFSISSPGKKIVGLSLQMLMGKKAKEK